MGDMTPTDELCRLLDERGVKHEGGERSVRWRDHNGVMMQAFPLANGELGMEVWSCTPEQAIDATLGREPDDAAMVRLHDQMNATMLKYEMAQGIEKRDGDEAIVVPWVAKMHALLEEAATLGRGECYDDSEAAPFFSCSECGCTHWRNVAFVDMPRYCPNCGRRVVSE